MFCMSRKSSLLPRPTVYLPVPELPRHAPKVLVRAARTFVRVNSALF